MNRNVKEHAVNTYHWMILDFPPGLLLVLRKGLLLCFAFACGLLKAQKTTGVAYQVPLRWRPRTI